MIQRARLRKIGARRSTGAAMSPGRRAGLGGTRARHTRRVYNICYRFTGNATDAQDLSQEVFLRIYRTLASYRPAYGAFPTWLTSVTSNLLVDHYRRTRHDRVTDSIDDAMPILEEKHSQARTPDRLAEASELSAQLQRGLARLSPELREAVILRDLQGLEYNEIQDRARSARRHRKIENQPRPHRAGAGAGGDGRAAVIGQG